VAWTSNPGPRHLALPSGAMAPIDEASDPDETAEVSWITALLRFEREGDTFLAPRPAGSGGRLFGGLIAAQALAAACTTIGDGKLPQSLHAYFVRTGQPDVDVQLEVERTRDGRSFDTRRVTVTQQGAVILEMLASFHRPENGVDTHPPEPAMIDLADSIQVPVPDELADRFEIRAVRRGGSMWEGPPYWIRTHQEIEDDPIVRACTLTFMSDMGLMAAARPPDTPLFSAAFAASLDHSIWFHRPFRPTEWHSYQATSLNNNDNRGLALGGFYDASGSLIATMTQEALWRM
jgi:acyl-CoA thioesterase-2